MKVYVDLYFLINYILDLTLLCSTGRLLKRKVKIYRYLLGSFIGGLSILLLFININDMTLLFLKFFISILMILITFGRKELVKNIFYFYILSIILGGSFYLFDLNFDYTNKAYYLNYLLLLVCSPIILYIFISDNIKNKVANTHKYLVEIRYRNDIFKTYGMIDTGNCLKDPYKKRGIVLIDYEFEVDDKKSILVPFKALNSNGLIRCFKPDKLTIGDKDISNLLVGVSSNELNMCGCRCILPNTLMEEL